MPRTAAFAGDCSEFTEKRNPVAFDHGSGIVFGESEVEIALPVGPGTPPNTGGKAVNEPWESQVTRAKDGKFSFVGGPGWHVSIIKEATYLSDLGILADEHKLIGRKKQCPLPPAHFVGLKRTA